MIPWHSISPLSAGDNFQTHILKKGGPYHFNVFKGCLPQISLGPFLNTLYQMFLVKKDFVK